MIYKLIIYIIAIIFIVGALILALWYRMNDNND